MDLSAFYAPDPTTAKYHRFMEQRRQRVAETIDQALYLSNPHHYPDTARPVPESTIAYNMQTAMQAGVDAIQEIDDQLFQLASR